MNTLLKSAILSTILYYHPIPPCVEDNICRNFYLEDKTFWYEGGDLIVMRGLVFIGQAFFFWNIGKQTLLFVSDG